MKRPRPVFLALIAGLLLGTVAATAGFAEGFRIVSVDVRGAHRVSADAIRQVMKTRVGQELDLDRVREDVKAIYKMGYFKDVTFDTEEVPGGYRLTVIVTEKPIVGSVVIEGNKNVETSDLRAAVTLKDRTLFQEDKVKESVKKIEEVCQSKGYYDAKVDAAVSEDAEGAIRVVFRVSEGPKLKIVKIHITGNLYYSEKSLRKVMDTTEKGFLSFITDSGTFKKDVLDNDVRKIEALYQNAGFLDSKVFDPAVSRGKNGLDLAIRIYEGKQYRVGEIRFAGDSGIPEETLRKTVKLARGEIFDREKLLADLLALTTLVNDRGYAQALVSPGVQKRKEYPLADVTYRIERGAKFHFGTVEISGNTKTLDRIIRRNLEVADGQTYSATGLKNSKENLTRTSFFKDVKISTAPAKTPGEMDVKVDVKEGPTGTFSGGMGYSSLDKVFGVVQVSENNLFGRAWRASLNTQFGARRTSFVLDFRDPYFLDTDFNLLLSAYNTRIKYNDFERKSVGGRVGVGYNLSKFVNTSLTLRADSTKILEVQPTLSLELRNEFNKGLQHTRSVIYNVTRNTTDKYIDPSRGSVQSGSLEYAGGPFGGDSQFVKYFLNAKAYYPVTESTVFSWNVTWGHIIDTKGGVVPLFERFFLGGPYSIRGFRDRTLSPKDPNTGELIGGNKELIGNLEYQFPLAGDIGFKGVFFFDAGNTWGQGEWPWKGEQILFAYGAGLRWFSPMGPLRFELGRNINRPAGAPRQVFQFTIGTAF